MPNENNEQIDHEIVIRRFTIKRFSSNYTVSVCSHHVARAET